MIMHGNGLLVADISGYICTEIDTWRMNANFISENESMAQWRGSHHCWRRREYK